MLDESPYFKRLREAKESYQIAIEEVFEHCHDCLAKVRYAQPTCVHSSANELQLSHQ